MAGFITAVGLGFVIIFVAELGDKSQLLAVTFSIRYRPVVVLAGVTLAVLATQSFSVAVGHGLGTAIPARWTSLAAGLAFLAFGAWTLREAGRADNATTSPEPSQQAGNPPKRAIRSRLPVLIVAVAVFGAELGDKTMLATIALAAQHGWAAIWVGSTLGMLAASLIAVAIGGWLRGRLPIRRIGHLSAALFLGVGVWLTVDAIGCLRH